MSTIHFKNERGRNVETTPRRYRRYLSLLPEASAAALEVGMAKVSAKGHGHQLCGGPIKVPTAGQDF